VWWVSPSMMNRVEMEEVSVDWDGLRD
jgi:hypothetical protein